MKMSIEWHKQSLENRKASLLHLQKEFENMENSINRKKSEISNYEYQINLAIEKKKDGFDRDKFGKKVSAN